MDFMGPCATATLVGTSRSAVRCRALEFTKQGEFKRCTTQLLGTGTGDRGMGNYKGKVKGDGCKFPTFLKRAVARGVLS
jgi:hypothetical protein